MKRDKQDTAILVLSILVAVLLIVFIVVKAFNLKIGKTEAPPAQPTAAPSDDAQQGFQFSDTPEIILGSGNGQGRAETSEISTDSGNVEMTLVTGSFAQRGGPDFSLYLDQDTFQMTEIDGHCYFCLHGDFSASLYLELAYHDGADAQTLAASLLNDYGLAAEPQNNGTVPIGDYSAINVQGSSLETSLDAYLIPTGHGCITLVLCTPGGAASSNALSLQATMTTLVLTEN